MESLQAEMNAARTTLRDLLWRWQRAAVRACGRRHEGVAISSRKRGLSPLLSSFADRYGRSLVKRLLFVLLILPVLGAPSVLAQITRIGQSSVATGGTGATSLVVATPAGTVLNDMMLAVVTVRGAGQTINLPAGWTAVAGLSSSVGGNLNQRVFYRVATAAEPASHAFSWTVSDRGLAAVVTYRNVDFTTPIDAAGAQTSAASTNIVAPSISTTVANTMLVGFFGDAHSGASFTTPAGMMNIFGAGSEPASGAGPNGARTLIAEELRAPTGATGPRTAVSSQNVANIGHILALRPAVVIVTPGSFNAFETNTAAGAIAGVIRTKVAGSVFSLDVVAISGGAQQAGFTDAVIVDLLGNNNLGVALDAQNCPTSFTLVQTVAPNPTIAGGRSTVNFAAVANSWRDLRVRIRWPTSAPTVASCSTDNFALRPNALAGFSVTDNDWQTAGTARTLGNTGAPPGGVIHKAGRPFTVQATAVNGAGVPATTTNYTGTATATLSDCGGSSACPSTLGTVTLGASFVAGVLTANTASYDEVGSFSMQLQDTAFASVDAGDGTPADCSASGRYVCSGALDVGRFVPDHFAVALNTPSFGTACGSFTYVGQRFNYTTAPVITLTARNFAGGTTTNYAGGLWQITNASLTGKSYTAAAGTLDISGLPGTDPVIFSAGAGTGTLSFGSGTGPFFTRTTPVAPFDADISLAINVIDADGVTAATNPVTFGTATPGNGIAFSSGKSLRFGRLTVRSASGSQLLSLQVPVEAQYWSGAPINGFLTNTLDSCTTIASANDAMGNYAGNLSGSPTCETAVMSGGALGAGRGVLVLAAPGAVNNGSVDLTVNLGATGSGSTCTTQGGAPGSATTANLPHLQGNWSGGAYDQNPTARATFGISRGSEEVVFVRENF
ncbi:MAG TPA: DUF6701 domain-containing protein [Burkholderiales bacterium]|nr:DUF6701 domain-containing protein [Burkholderiales bacterium]